ncbi:MAG TPA: histidinol dehydrogenase [Sediminispirochaeta sp.]|nr:histidinol dehydrogenase [Sediminispirochaeta sp.]
MRIKAWKDYSEEDKLNLFRRSESDISEVEEGVRGIISEVKRQGDRALREFSQQFDHVDLSDRRIAVQSAEFDEAERKLDKKTKESLDYAIDKIYCFHLTQKPQGIHFTPLGHGLMAGEKASPIDSVGLYVPRGRGSFPSMLYMLAVPARVAEVPLIQVVTPPNPDGSVDPACLYCARRLGVDSVYRVGGAQAIAALAYGTESIRRAVKVVGPGSRYVAAAKRLLSSVIDTGLPAGPSESMIVADDTAEPWDLALDLMVEAEHGSDSCAVLLTDSRHLAQEVAEAVEELLREVPEPRLSFLHDVLQRYGGIIFTEDIQEAVQIVNQFGPEHLQLRTSEPFSLMEEIHNAGEILLGPHLPFSAANYLTGVNAVLPTGGWAKTYSPVSVRDFIKYSSVVYAERQAYDDFAEHTRRIAEYEGFHTHAAAIRRRGERSR